MDKVTVLKVAKLTRIKLDASKVDRYVQEISNIMDAIEELKTADVSDLQPLVNISEFELVKRKDEITDGNCTDAILKNAPKQKLGYFAVPKVIE